MARVPMQRRVMSHHPQPNFHANQWHLRPAWQSSWHALDTHFENGQDFLETLHALQSDPLAPDRLFYTAFAEQVPQQLAPQLAKVCLGLLPGLHRFSFENSRVQLNLCIGPLASSLKEVETAADSICVDHFLSFDPRSIARLSKWGTTVHWSVVHAEALTQLKASGFIVNNLQSSAVFQPHWKAPSAKLTSAKTPISKGKINVIGAGLAGSAVAYSLARRGWQVEVIDQHFHTGGGASALPAGIFASHVSPDNNVLSRITRDGVRATVQRATDLLIRGKEWELSHLIEHRYSGKRQLPSGEAWPKSGLDWMTETQDFQNQLAGLNSDTLALWHKMAGWIQTPSLVNAQLKHPNISCRWGLKVSQLVRHQSTWQLMNECNEILSTADHVVIANAHACQTLLNGVQRDDKQAMSDRPFIPLTPLRGQVTFGEMALIKNKLRNKLPRLPVNGHGSYIGQLPAIHHKHEGHFWIIGSSFQRFDLDTNIRQEDQFSNLKQWAELMPAWHDDILEGVDIHKAKAWAGIRAALPDRLPAVGAFKHPEYKGIHVCTGMGARGISWSVLCGELLASQLNHEPMPMAASLAKLLAASRFG